jgi:hypothetical protein
VTWKREGVEEQFVLDLKELFKPISPAAPLPPVRFSITECSYSCVQTRARPLQDAFWRTRCLSWTDTPL